MTTDHIDRLARSVTVVTAIVGVIGTVVGGFAAVTGGTERLFREQRELTLWALALIGISSVLVLLTMLRYRTNSKARRQGLSLGLATFAVGAVFFVAAAILIPGIRIRPSLTAALTLEGTALVRVTGEGAASNLRASDSLTLDVSGVLTFLTSIPPESVFRGDTGPDAAGMATIPFDVAFPKTRFDAAVVRVWSGGAEPPDCDRLASDPTLGSCIVIPMPSGRLNDRLTAAVEDGELGRHLVLTLFTGTLGLGESGRNVSVRAADDSGAPVVELATIVRPDDNGLIDTEIRIPLPGDRPLTMCATATRIADATSRDYSALVGVCPDEPETNPVNSGAEWVRLRIQARDGS